MRWSRFAAVFRHAFGRLRGQILGWGLALALLGLYVVYWYDVFASQKDLFAQLFKGFPPELSAVFGDLARITTPDGYLAIQFFSYLPLVLGVFAVLGGSGLLASDEENGTLDLVLAHPVSRTILFAGRLLAFVAALAAILLITWAGVLVAQRWSTLDIAAGPLLLPFISLLAVLVLYGSLALLLALVMASRRAAAMTAGIVLLVSFFMTSLGRLTKDLGTIASLSPLTYYQSGFAIEGLNLRWLLGLALGALFLAGLALWRFGLKDIRAGGEGSAWRPAFWWRSRSR